MYEKRIFQRKLRFLTLAIAVIAAVLAEVNAAQAAVVLPKPTFANSIIISLDENSTSSDEIAYIKANFPFGLYAWPSISKTAVPVLAWISDWSAADDGIEAFKTSVDTCIAAAKAGGVKFHLVVCSGLARGIGIYADAKMEDVRNAQWFNDNNLGTAEQVASSEAMTRYVFGTFSRYARKLRANLEAKSRAAFAFLKQRMNENPGTFLVISGWGEAEMSNQRIDYSIELQPWFCDYSPFAVLEFRDWIQHAGLYDDTTGAFKGKGWAKGGKKYRGTSGLAHFNAAFGTLFASWDLRYFNWSLADDWDSVPQDGVNADPGRIPLSSYVQDGMRPSSGAHYIEGGFDPPRTMNPGGKFWDLWNLFRATMVHNLVTDTAGWARAAGIPADRWYSHQIPADYLFGTKPSGDNKNARYYSSASPLWTAGLSSSGSTGASIYDVKFADGTIVRTTAWIYPAISAMSDNWAIMEYDAETYAEASSTQSSSDDILVQYLRAYSYKPHLINFYCWTGDNDHRIKGMNKETALRAFIGKIRDKARSTNLNIVFAPPKVAGLSGSYGAVAASSSSFSAPEGIACVRLQLTGKIWEDEAWIWADWGDFDHFEVYRGPTAKFSINKAHLIGTTTTYFYDDKTAASGSVYYYAWRAVNKAGVKGAPSNAVMVTAAVTTIHWTAASDSWPASGSRAATSCILPRRTALAEVRRLKSS